MTTEISPDIYDHRYYGMGPEPPTGNYRDYGPHSNVGWTLPLARLLAQHTQGSLLDIGCAYGHLVRTLSRLGVAAQGIDWSPWATGHAVAPSVQRLDARELLATFGPDRFAAVTSLDLLEHLPEPACRDVILQIATVLRPGGITVHLVGAPMGEADPSHHYDDPSHVNHQPLSWYVEQFADAGLLSDAALTEQFNNERAWRTTDWHGRWVAFRKPA